ncbi:MAG TPA: hypothetical protein PLE99_05965 [Candidatus Thiothrix moscowensis]|uniref:hypothetical protein n=1 Tax=unclassified Thiothrix TaxID=2636184 RepID=UPI0025E779A4|nr:MULTISPECIES: hypothetical protein [unclassified Thiothrix]HRJ52291.1 hypothetical protein [Candidatus Thiothrix moscowensis]HRJ92606.1 hypothetical protein [Candidatus Thiothrix moscowensis]
MDTSPNPTLLTPEQVLANFRATGTTVAGWCRLYKFNRSTVNALLHRNAPGLRGESHRAAIALGLKADPSKDSPEKANPDKGVSHES